ncbi:MAG: chromosomal replication initiator protein DnaA, partial [Alphaproteobacteria bacterium]|nr:chromosomal replication initiator protein DnaA [Alphaproteobacteria bacterium]
MSAPEDDEDCQVFLHPVQVQTLWDQVCQRLKNELGNAIYASWIEPLKVITYDGQCLQLAAPTRFMKDRIQTQHGEKLLVLCHEIFPGFEDYTIAIAKKEKGHSNEVARVDPFQDQVIEAILEPDEEDYTAALDIRFTFENFVIGKPNELAYAASLRIAEADIPPFNPMFLYGGVGLGKTHLMHAIAWHIKKVHPRKRVIYMSAEKFMYEFVRALRFKDTVSFKERFRNIDILMIDDVQFISGKDTTQEEFFHTFNALIDNNHQVIISADKSPSDLEGMEERLRSRLGWGLVADIHPTTYELR